MKLTILLLAISMLQFSCKTDSTQNDLAQSDSTVTFVSDTLLFKHIPIGDSIHQTIQFTNTTNKPVNIINVGVSCGCTATQYNKEEIPVGGKGEIGITYTNSEDDEPISKPIIVELNTPKVYNVIYMRSY